MVSRGFLPSLFWKRPILFLQRKKQWFSFHYLREILHSELLSIFITLSAKRKRKEALSVAHKEHRKLWKNWILQEMLLWGTSLKTKWNDLLSCIATLLLRSGLPGTSNFSGTPPVLRGDVKAGGTVGCWAGSGHPDLPPSQVLYVLSAPWPQLGTQVLMIKDNKCHQVGSLVRKAPAPLGSWDASSTGLVPSPGETLLPRQWALSSPGCKVVSACALGWRDELLINGRWR